MIRLALTPLLAVARTTYGEVTGHPSYWITMLAALAAQAAAPAVALFGFEHDRSLMREFSLSTLLVAGLVLAATGAMTVHERERSSGTLQALLCKPAGRGAILAGKLLGLIAAIGAGLALALAVFLLADRQGPPSSVHAPWDWPVIVCGLGGAVATVATVVPMSLARSRPFGPLALRVGCFAMGAALAVAACFDGNWQLQVFGRGFDPLIVEAVYLVFLACGVLASVALLASLAASRAAWPATLLAFLAALYVGGRSSPWLGFLPALELFWAGDAFYASLDHLPALYLLMSTGYAAAYSLVCLLIGVWLLGRYQAT